MVKGSHNQIIDVLNLGLSSIFLFFLNYFRFQNQKLWGGFSDIQPVQILLILSLLGWGLFTTIQAISDSKSKNRWINFGALISVWGLILVSTFEETNSALWDAAAYLSTLIVLFFLLGKILNQRLILNRLSIKSKLAIKTTLVVGLTVLFSMIGTLINVLDAGLLCRGFPFCFREASTEPLVMLVMGHRILIGVTFLILLQIFLEVWKRYRHETLLLTATTSMFVLFIGQGILGAYQTFNLFPADLILLHSFCALGFMAALSLSWWVTASTDFVEIKQTNHIFNDKQRRLDFLKLNKPIIVVLLLVITYAGMIVGAEKIPPFGVTFWTLFAGALAAGGSSAINQYIDREIDFSMQRTAKRPIPSGRLKPAEALALGMAELIISFFIYVFFVNLTAALLALAGMIYYVVIYSLWLKHATVQNIVIGGGAGAIPPLVGWAAATGSLNFSSLFLFAIVFLWTPPHFWALALLRRNDYARAKVPMLPVIKGEKTTKIQIMIYTIELVLLTLLMPLFNLGGGLFFGLAFLLGGWILWAAWNVFRKEGNKVAYKMYRYSSMYLAFIFFALVIDVLV